MLILQKKKDTMLERKKVSGIKRHIAVDTQGIPHAIHVTTANVTDRVGAVEAFKNSSVSHLSNQK